MLVHSSLTHPPPSPPLLHRAPRSQPWLSTHTVPLPSSEGCGPVRLVEGSRGQDGRGDPGSGRPTLYVTNARLDFRRASFFVFLISSPTIPLTHEPEHSAGVANHSRSNPQPPLIDTKPNPPLGWVRTLTTPAQRRVGTAEEQNPAYRWVRTTTTAARTQQRGRDLHEGRTQPTAGYAR
jgi:hypothetical protein